MKWTEVSSVRRLKHIIFLAIAPLCIYAQNSVLINFDDPLPLTPYKIALRTSMQLYHDLDILQDADIMPHARALLCDAMLGKAVRLYSAVTALLADAHNAPVMSDDGAYLLTVVMQLEQLIIRVPICDEAHAQVIKTRDTLMQFCLSGLL